VKSAKAGYYPDGDGAYLQYSSTAARSWVYRYKLHGRVRAMGLGSYPDMNLAEAREDAKKMAPGPGARRGRSR
jgi:hypothetical protein